MFCVSKNDGWRLSSPTAGVSVPKIFPTVTDGEP